MAIGLREENDKDFLFRDVDRLTRQFTDATCGNLTERKKKTITVIE